MADMKVLRLLIVDDEPLVLRGLQETYNWEKMGYEVVGTALDGDEALPMVEELQPDVIMTDIRMRRVSGLELMEQVKSRHPDVAFVVLSAYKDFEYARQACGNGAMSYLVKPIDDVELEENMHEVYTKCSSRLKEKHKIENWKKLLLEDKDNFLQIMTERFLNNGLSETELDKIYHELGEEGYIDGYFLCICADIDTFYQITNQESYVAKRHILGKRLRETLEKKYKTESLRNENSNFVLVIRTEKEEGVLPFKQLLWSLQQELDIEIISAISNCYQGLGGMKKAYMEVNRFYEIACEAGASALTVNTQHSAEITVSYPIDTETQLLQAVREANTDKLKAAFERFVCELDEASGKIFLHRVMVRIESSLQAAGNLTDENARSFENFYTMLFRLSLVRMVDLAYKLLVEVVEHKKTNLSKISENIFQEYIGQALHYIEEHLGDETLSIGDVAAGIYLNQAYFGRVFKAVMQVSFKKYVLNQRIELAKQLLAENRYSITEVGKRVGIPNSSYFTKLFKDVTGKLPSAYIR